MEPINVRIAPSFYASLKKLSEEEQAEVMKMIADMSEMTSEELAAKAICTRCEKTANTCECSS